MCLCTRASRHVHVQVWSHVQVCMCVSASLRIYACVFMSMPVCLYACVYVPAYLCVHVCLHLCVCNVCLCLYTPVCVYVSVCACLCERGVSACPCPCLRAMSSHGQQAGRDGCAGRDQTGCSSCHSAAGGPWPGTWLWRSTSRGAHEAGLLSAGLGRGWTAPFGLLSIFVGGSSKREPERERGRSGLPQPVTSALG